MFLWVTYPINAPTKRLVEYRLRAKHFLKMRDFGDFNFFNKDCIILSEECDDYNNMSLDDCFTSPRAVGGGGGGSSLTELSEDLVVQLDIDQKKKKC